MGLIKNFVIQCSQRYHHLLTTKPYLTNALTTCGIIVMGDCFAQMIEMNTYHHLHEQQQQQQQQEEEQQQQKFQFQQREGEKQQLKHQEQKNEEEKRNLISGREWNYRRTASMFVWGTFLSFPSLFWLKSLDKFFGKSQKWYVIGAKVAVHLIGFTIPVNALYLTYVTFMEHASKEGWTHAKEIWSYKMRNDFPSIAANSVKVWTLAHVINFTVVPPDYRLLLINCVAVMWTCYLSLMGYKQSVNLPIFNDDDPSTLQQQQQQQQQQLRTP